MVSKEELIKKALEAREKAYVPYSKFPVGAALITKEGKIFTGCNIENAAFPVTCCAERTALFKAVSEGERSFEALAVVADTERPVSPCGSCRQALAELCPPEMPVYLANVKGEMETTDVASLLPGAFGAKDLVKR
ncbi:MAG: cytidine deaminase [Thermicanus sp.]|nr:cytidine deaminase [Thermicanus sp.]